MKEIKWLIYRVFTILDMIETTTNQPKVREIRGLLNEVLSLLE